jgi:hypothetical protein
MAKAPSRAPRTQCRSGHRFPALLRPHLGGTAPCRGAACGHTTAGDARSARAACSGTCARRACATSCAGAFAAGTSGSRAPGAAPALGDPGSAAAGSLDASRGTRAVAAGPHRCRAAAGRSVSAVAARGAGT